MSMHRWLIPALTLVLGACTSSPAPRYFRLAPSDTVTDPATGTATDTATATGGAAVVVGPFEFPEYLDRPQLVTRQPPNGLSIADYERWAEPLAANFQSVVAANAARLLGSDQVLEFPAGSIVAGARRVTGRVLAFDVDTGGRAVLEVQWGVVDATGAALRPARVSRHEARATGRDAAARVAALNATVDAFSAEVAAALR